jgi:phosphatidylglycerophosphate synthase
MLSRWARRWSSQFFSPLISVLFRLGVTPNGLTAVGLGLAVLSGVSIAFDRLVLAAVWIILSGLCDALDGELARAREKFDMNLAPTNLGAFIDSVADHYGDFALYFGTAWRALHQSDPLSIYLVLLAMFGSLVGSQIRSRAGMVGIDTKNVGSFTRMERTLVWLGGLLTGWMVPALGLLAVFTNLSAIQRILFVLKAGSAVPARPKDPAVPQEKEKEPE